MPSKEQDWAIDAIRDHLEKHISDDDEKRITGELWLPNSAEEKRIKEDFQKKIYKEWEKQKEQIHDPVTKLRKDVMDELSDIKKALNKLGVLLDSDAPTEEQLEKHKTLKEAYLKYKMVEKLVLGDKAK